jgi:hypothetical protein
MLNLDAEEENTDRECLLCKNTNHSYLDEMHSALSASSSKKNLFDMLYDAYIKQKNRLKQQNNNLLYPNSQTKKYQATVTNVGDNQ